MFLWKRSGLLDIRFGVEYEVELRSSDLIGLVVIKIVVIVRIVDFIRLVGFSELRGIGLSVIGREF